jgi:hypothetical protein
VLSSGTKYTSAAAAAAASRPAVLNRPGVFLQQQRRTQSQSATVQALAEKQCSTRQSGAKKGVAAVG